MGKIVTTILVVIIVILVVICVILGCLFALKDAGKTGVCMTRRCLADSVRIKGLMNTSVDPCEDFYEFACGGFELKPYEPKQWFGTSARLGMQITEQIRRLLEASITAEDGSAEKKMRDFYKSCIQPAATEERQMTVLRELMRDIGGFGSGLTVDDIGPSFFDRRNFNFEDALKYVTVDLSTTVLLTKNVRVVKTEEGDRLESAFWLGDGFTRSCREFSKEYAKELALCFGKDTGNFESDVADVYGLLCKNDTSYPGETIIKTWNEFVRTVPVVYEDKIDWYGLLAKQYKQLNKQKVYYDNSTIARMEDLVEMKENVEPRKIRNFLLFRFLSQYANAMPKCIMDAERATLRAGYAMAYPRWRWCIKRQMNRAFHWAILAMLENSQDQPMTTDEKLFTMLEQVRTRAIERSKGLGEGWLDERLKKVMEKRIRDKVVMMAGPRRITDPPYINRFYEHLDVNASEPYLVNLLNSNKFLTLVHAVALHHPTIETLLFIQAPDAMFVNAYNKVDKGGMAIFWPMAQEPFYNYESQDYLNYGGTGALFGHEFGHDFDGANTFRYWANRTAGDIPALVEAGECLLKYTDKLEGIERNYTEPIYYLFQPQKMSDISGNKWSWEAYKMQIEEKGQEEDLLPGLPYTQHQLFYISFAQTWCRDAKPRVNVASAQDPFFNEAFKCPVDSPMNPKDRCNIW